MKSSSWSNFFIKVDESIPDTATESIPLCRTDTVDKGYFEALGIQLLRGRLFNEFDYANQEWVAAVRSFIAEA